jgi:hypothetical protein
MNYGVSGDSVLTLNKDIREARTCFENAAYKATMVLCGSVLEHALLDYLSIDESTAKNTYRTIFGKRARSIDHWKLDEMLQVSRDLNLITTEIYQLCDMLRDYRNLIHPAVSRRTSVVPNRIRGQRSLEATKQTLEHLESQFVAVWQDLYVINIQNIQCHFVGNKSAIQTAANNMAAGHGLNHHSISSYAALNALLQNPPRNVILVNTHGEIMPVPRGRNWRSFYSDMAKAVKSNGWILVNVGGYPFFYERSIQLRHQVGPDGLNTFLSAGNVSANCMASANVDFTSDGLNVIRLASMTGLPHTIPSSRCARWQGVSQLIAFLRSGNLCGASAIRIGRGWFVHVGLSSTLGFANPTPQQLAFGDAVLGNLGVASALYVAGRL